jgi:hypothetical protein
MTASISRHDEIAVPEIFLDDGCRDGNCGELVPQIMHAGHQFTQPDGCGGDQAVRPVDPQRGGGAEQAVHASGEDGDAKIRAPQPLPGLQVRAASDLDGRERTVRRLPSGDRFAIERALAEVAHQHPAAVMVGRDHSWEVTRAAPGEDIDDGQLGRGFGPIGLEVRGRRPKN